MACRDISHSWTFSGLVGAFLDLAIAYFLLCCSAVTFFIAKFLGLFGFSLPCPCNGLFGFPYRGPCLQKLLVDRPAEAVSYVHFYVKSKFPFDVIFERNDHCLLSLKLVRERRLGDGGLELEAEASYSSSSDPRRSQQSLSGSDSIGKIDFKGKGTAHQRQRCSLHRRRRGSIDYGKLTPSSSYEHMRSDAHVLHRSPSEPCNMGSELISEKLMPMSLSDPSSIPGKSVLDGEPEEQNGENKLVSNSAISFANLRNKVGDQDENALRILEHVLEEAQAARAALCSELEQERIAAATAADEAMAMISRLQEEKASIEIEARQYQRILEEKSAYDAEEMNILKEIIVMREREKHFLEKEVEAYRKVIQDSEGLTSQVSGTQGQNEDSIFDSSVDAMLMLQQLSESLDKRGSMQDKGNYLDYASASVEKQTFTAPVSELSSVVELDDKCKLAEGIDSPEYSSVIQDHLHNGDEFSQDIQEKGMLSIDEIPCPQFCKSSSSPDHDFLVNDTIVGEQRQNNNVYPLQSALDGVKKIEDGEVVKVGVSEPHVHDIHIVDSKCDTCNESTSSRVNHLLMQSDASNVERKFELQLEGSNFERVDESANSLRAELDIGRSCSDIVHRFPSVSSSPGRSYVSELRQNSLSAVDHERLKIDHEIGWLREKLRAVQEEKEKLKNSLKRRERGRTELQLLEDIATQLQEIRHLTGPGKASRHALPPLSSKVTLKKRRSRSISGGVCQSAFP
uniref:GTD-binding domain-containing protein n=1 Tax=Opuntia streptacantha TaxID=393608 RepID=A0A7C9D9T0_OPUST